MLCQKSFVTGAVTKWQITRKIEKPRPGCGVRLCIGLSKSAGVCGRLVFVGLLFAADFVGYGEAFAAFCTATCEDFATVGCGHAGAETVFVDAFAVMGLVCTFHCLMEVNVVY